MERCERSFSCESQVSLNFPFIPELTWLTEPFFKTSYLETELAKLDHTDTACSKMMTLQMAIKIVLLKLLGFTLSPCLLNPIQNW